MLHWRLKQMPAAESIDKNNNDLIARWRTHRKAVRNIESMDE